jgi:hypothetical protein
LCDQNKEFVSRFSYFHQLTTSQSKISIQPFQELMVIFLNNFGGWKIKNLLVIFNLKIG